MRATGKLRRLWLWWGHRHKRCDLCGRMAHLDDAWHTFGNRDGKVWHAECSDLVLTRRVAEERLAVLDLVTDVIGLSEREVVAMAELRANTGESYVTTEQSNASNRAWRAMRDVEKLRDGAS